LMVKAYQEQIRTGKISLDEGQGAIDRLYEQLLEKYPTCPAAAQARQALVTGQNSVKGGRL
jgi:hypothetical protein